MPKILYTLDTTGSMRPAKAQARQHMKQITEFLFGQIPGMEMAIITHGDYIDGSNLVNVLDFTKDERTIQKFIDRAPDTSGGDSDEAYEYVFNVARGLSWGVGDNKAMVMIADADPHELGERSAGKLVTLDWREELKLLVMSDIKVYPVQALAHYGSGSFYAEIARTAGTPHLKLEQFTDVRDLLTATAMHTADKLKDYEDYLRARGSVSVGTQQTIAQLSGRTFERKRGEATRSGMSPVEPSRFQVFDVDRDVRINDFVRENGLMFNVGRGFYEFKVRVKVQDYKEVIVQDRETGEMFSGNEARRILGIPTGKYGTVSVSPDRYERKWRGFIQSTSATRKLLKGTKFLYEAERF